MKLKELQDKLGPSYRYISQKRNKNFVIMKGFFYTNGYNAEKLWNSIHAAIPNAICVRQEEIWKPFKGGSPMNKSSRWEVEFTVPE